MKLAILGTRGLPARYGGFETFTQELATRLVAAGIEVTVFCPAESPRADEEYRGVTLRYVRVSMPRPFDQLIWDATCFLLCRGEYDLVYMLGTGGGFMAWAPRLFGAQVWTNTDGIEWRRTKWSLLGRTYVRIVEALSVLFSNRVIADSKAIEDYLRDTYGRWAVVSTIAYGAYPPESTPDAALLDEWSVRAGEYYIVVCRLEPENHVEEIVQGYEQSGSPLPLVVLGSIENPSRYVRALLKHRSDRVRFVGTVFEKSKLDALRYHARAYLHGHSVGGTNPSLLEAMACENAVIAHDNPFNREVLENRGLFFATAGDVARHIRAIEEGRLDLMELRRQVKKIVSHRYTWDGIASEYLALIRGTTGHLRRCKTG